MSKQSNESGVGVLGLLGLAFVVLKLIGVIDWSWWYVTLPFWGGIVLSGIGLVMYIIFETLIPKKRSVPKMKNPPNHPIKESRFKKRLREAEEAYSQNKK